GDRGARRAPGDVHQHLRGRGAGQARRRRRDDREVLRMSIDLTGKVAAVTGSGQGLGRAYARALAAAGAAVVVNDVNAESAQATVDVITADGGKAVTLIGPVGPTETAERIVAAAVESFGRLDVLV